MINVVSHWSVHARGFPDLILVRTSSSSTTSTTLSTTEDQKKNNDNDNDNTATPSVLFVEVKGEKDRLRDDQLDWLGVFEEKGLNVEVCQVRRIGK